MAVLNVHEYDTLVEERFPWIPWRTPVSVLITGPHEREGLGCRLCIARLGAHGHDYQPMTEGEFEQHMIVVHGDRRE